MEGWSCNKIILSLRKKNHDMLICVMLSCQNHIDGLELSLIHSAMLTTWSTWSVKEQSRDYTSNLFMWIVHTHFL